MAQLVYITNMSLDGFIEDKTGDFSWTLPESAFAFITELLRPLGTYVYGRRLYETMAYWGRPVAEYPVEHHDFARTWQQSEKIVFSRTLTSASTNDTRIEREFSADLVRSLKERSIRDIGIGGAELAGLALAAGIVDECHLFVHPIVVGGGKRAFNTHERRRLDLLETRQFDGGVLYTRYRVRYESP